MGDQQRDEFMYPETATTEESPLQGLLGRPSQADRSREHETRKEGMRTIEVCRFCRRPAWRCFSRTTVTIQIPENMTDAAYTAAHERGGL